MGRYATSTSGSAIALSSLPLITLATKLGAAHSFRSSSDPSSSIAMLDRTRYEIAQRPLTTADVLVDCFDTAFGVGEDRP